MMARGVVTWELEGVGVWGGGFELFSGRAS